MLSSYEISTRFDELFLPKSRKLFKPFDDSADLKTTLRNSYLPFLLENGYILLHATLIKVQDRYFLLAGSSGSGKTTYANFSKKTLNATVLGNDYIVGKIIDSEFFVSDINFEEELKHERPVKVSGIFVCSSEVSSTLDIEVLSDISLASCLLQVMDRIPLNASFVSDFLKYWQTYNATPVYKIYVRRGAIERTGELFSKTIQQFFKSNYKIGVIGLGSIGTALAAQLLTKDYLDTLYLLTRDKKKQHGLYLDFDNAAKATSNSPVVVGCSSVADLGDADVLFLCVRITHTNAFKFPEERMNRVRAHLDFVQKLVVDLRKASFSGKIFVVTNPVEILTYAFYQVPSGAASFSELYSNQVFGIGLELDRARALSLISSQKSFAFLRNALGNSAPYAFIQHGKHLALASESASSKELPGELLRDTRLLSSEIRKSVPRTIYGPVCASIKTMETVLGLNNDRQACVSVAYNVGVVGGPVIFSNGVPSYSLLKSLVERYPELYSSWCQEFDSSSQILGLV